MKGAMTIMKGELIKSLYRLARSTITNEGRAYYRKKNKSVEVELDRRKMEDGATNIFRKSSSSGLKLHERKRNTKEKAKNLKFTKP